MSHTTLPEPISADLAPLLHALYSLGFTPQSYNYSPSNFGNFEVIFGRNSGTFSVIRDRGQFLVSGERATLDPAGLFRAFDSVESLQSPLLVWLHSQHVA